MSVASKLLEKDRINELSIKLSNNICTIGDNMLICGAIGSGKTTLL